MSSNISLNQIPSLAILIDAIQMKKHISLLLAALVLKLISVAQTPYLVSDVMATGWSPVNRVLINNLWFYQIDSKELWVTDGTTAGTILLKTFGGNSIYNYYELNGKLLLIADNNANASYELWTSDGTVVGTVMVKDLQASNWDPTKRIIINNQSYFETDNGKLWKTDGTTVGTVLLKIFGGNDIYSFHALNNKLLLLADDNSNSTFELWTTDGTPAGTTMVKDVVATSWNPSNSLLINNHWFFETNNHDLWVTDGSTSGTVLLKTFGGSGLYTFHELNGNLLLFADNNVNTTYELWKSDGSTGGTSLVKDIAAISWNPSNRVLTNGQLFFEADNNKLWKTDGTTGGTILLKTFGGSGIYTFHELNSKLLLFADNNGNSTFELWASDATIAGTIMVTDLLAASWDPSNRILINNQWFFETGNNKLWKTDGTTAGTTLLKTFGGGGIYTFRQLNNNVLLYADDNSNNTYELWSSDGSIAGTAMVKDIAAANWTASTSIFINNQWLFETDHTELWKTDGTAAGTIMLKNFGGSNIYTFHPLSNKVLLFADDNNNTTYELWAADIPLEINNIANENSTTIVFFPNPFSHHTNIHITAGKKYFNNYTLTLINTAGQIVFCQKLKANTQSLNFNLPHATYFYNVYNGINKVVGDGKIVIQ